MVSVSYFFLMTHRENHGSNIVVAVQGDVIAVAKVNRPFAKLSTASVYADSGMANAEKMLVKAQHSTKIGEIIKNHRWSQQQATMDRIGSLPFAIPVLQHADIREHWDSNLQSETHNWFFLNRDIQFIYHI